MLLFFGGGLAVWLPLSIQEEFMCHDALRMLPLKWDNMS